MLLCIARSYSSAARGPERNPEVRITMKDNSLKFVTLLCLLVEALVVLQILTKHVRPGFTELFGAFAFYEMVGLHILFPTVGARGIRGPLFFIKFEFVVPVPDGVVVQGEGIQGGHRGELHSQLVPTTAE